MPYPVTIRRAADAAPSSATPDAQMAQMLSDAAKIAYYKGKREAYASVLGRAKGEMVRMTWVRDRMQEASSVIRDMERGATSETSKNTHE